MNEPQSDGVVRRPNMRRRRIATLIAAGASIALVTSACGSDDGDSGEDSGGGGTVKVATTPLAPFILPNIAVSEGLDKENGVTIVPTEYTSTATEIPQVLAGEINIGVGGSADVLSAVASGLPIKVIGTVASVAPESGEDAVVGLVTNDDSVQGPEDLANKPIGVNSLKTYNSLSATATLMEAGVPVDEAVFVSIPYASLPAAVEKKQVAAAVLQEPALTQAVNSGARLLAGLGPDVGANTPANLYFVSAEWAKTNKDDLEAAVAALKAVIEQASSDGDFLRAQILKEIPIPDDVSDTMNLPTFSTDVPDASFDEVTSLLAEVGYIEDAPSAEDYIIRP